MSGIGQISSSFKVLIVISIKWGNWCRMFLKFTSDTKLYSITDFSSPIMLFTDNNNTDHLLSITCQAMANHCSILAWKIPLMEEPGRLQPMGHKELDMTEWLHFHFHIRHSHEHNIKSTQKSQYSIDGYYEVENMLFTL